MCAIAWDRGFDDSRLQLASQDAALDLAVRGLGDRIHRHHPVR
jgi:hypothetical protein